MLSQKIVTLISCLLLFSTSISASNKYNIFRSYSNPAGLDHVKIENEDGTVSHQIQFRILYANVTRLKRTKQIVTVNGQFPGPSVYVHQNDHVSVKVSNYVNEKITIHWHGVRQMFTVWADGPAYVTQCPLQPGEHYTHDFNVTREQGTLFWHAHYSWQRATVYGAFIILPPKGKPYPFPIQPKAEFPILLGEWWEMDVLDVEKYGLADGGGYNISNATTINGQPGLLYNGSQKDTTTMKVTKGETYLLRIINAAMNFQMFFKIAGHQLTIVEIDCSLCKPYTTDVIVLAPGNTADVLVTANQDIGTYVMAGSVYSSAREDFVPFPHVHTSGLFVYDGAPKIKLPEELQKLEFPTFPAANDSDFALDHLRNLKSMDNKDVPQNIDRSFLFTVGYSLQECPIGHICHGPSGKKSSASVNNITFKEPEISILQAYYERTHVNSFASFMLNGSLTSKQMLDLANSTYQDDFPSMPLFQYNYTSMVLSNLHAEQATKVAVVDYKTNVQLVLQNTANIIFESHPFHLHGYNFYVVGMGRGTYDSTKDPAHFNLVDPPAMNTIAVPSGGWAALRFFTDNPGVWLMHCHVEMHASWGMVMAWIVKDGSHPHEKVPPPPLDYPKCILPKPKNT